MTRKRAVKCDYCKKRPATIFDAPDPFTAEVNPELPNEPRDWCAECYSDRKDDV